MITPGKTITTFSTKTGQTAEIRYLRNGDAADLMNFINTFSPEDSFTRFAGEQVTMEEEEKYVASELAAMEKGDAVKLFCFVDGKLAGVCDVHRNNSLLTRKRHVGILGIIIGKDYRGVGVGKQLIETTMTEAAKEISGMKIIMLDCFANNEPAITLYNKVGFTEVARIPKVLFRQNQYIDEVVMTKELGGLS